MTRQRILDKLLLGEQITIIETRDELNSINRVDGKIADVRKAPAYEKVSDLYAYRLIIYCEAYEQTFYRFIHDDYVEDLIKGKQIPCNVSREMLQLS